MSVCVIVCARVCSARVCMHACVRACRVDAPSLMVCVWQETVQVGVRVAGCRLVSDARAPRMVGRVFDCAGRRGICVMTKLCRGCARSREMCATGFDQIRRAAVG